jgi:hypothetical protein
MPNHRPVLDWFLRSVVVAAGLFSIGGTADRAAGHSGPRLVSGDRAKRQRVRAASPVPIEVSGAEQLLVWLAGTLDLAAA